MEELYKAQTAYLKAVANIGQLRKQLADVSIDNHLHPKVRAGLIARLDREIEEESVEATSAIEWMEWYMLDK